MANSFRRGIKAHMGNINDVIRFAGLRIIWYKDDHRATDSCGLMFGLAHPHWLYRGHDESLKGFRPLLTLAMDGIP